MTGRKKQGRYGMKSKQRNKIVFVCTGNTCRSPMAEANLGKKLREMKLTRLKVCSAGTHAKAGDTLNEKTLKTLKDKGVKNFTHEPQSVDKKLVRESLAIICMTDKQRDFMMDVRWQALRETGEEEIENNVYSFSELAGYEIIDPYGKDIDCYHYVYELLSGAMPALIDKLLPPPLREKFKYKPRAKSGQTVEKK